MTLVAAIKFLVVSVHLQQWSTSVKMFVQCLYVCLVYLILQQSSTVKPPISGHPWDQE